MKPDNSGERKKKLIKFGMLGFVTVCLFILLLSSLWQNNGTIMAAKPSDEKSVLLLQQNKRLQQYDELLHGKLSALQQLDKAFTASLTATGNSIQPDRVNRDIQQQEQVFSRLVDSLRLEVFKFTDTDIKSNFSKMITSFRLAVDNREAIGSLRNAVVMSTEGFTADEKAQLIMKNELDERRKKITALETALKDAERNNTAFNITPGNDHSKTMTENVATLESKIVSLTGANNILTQENEQLSKMQNETGNHSSDSETMLKDKANLLQQKVESLNAELQLLKVDCNLNRVDATQIISTAKQRKRLLTEASSILTDLSASANADIRKKIKEKIVRLNQVAANSRD